ncbi:hypothetical protein KO504_04290 [Winogradskyella psychrotolerans]|uniref:hypothetical protein n=1 Tax=Winogradskyella TaxID=286104 RepID=UPI001C073BC9|nr:hypothetical protein [Winogradskyella psychrotolerans]MBU2920550.1 hypothetical protein [Winogradskyella psychrotolerans]
MINTLIALYSWTSGVVMIAIFALVCITLVGILVNFISKSKSNDESNSLNEDNNSESEY